LIKQAPVVSGAGQGPPGPQDFLAASAGHWPGRSMKLETESSGSVK